MSTQNRRTDNLFQLKVTNLIADNTTAGSITISGSLVIPGDLNVRGITHLYNDFDIGDEVLNRKFTVDSQTGNTNIVGTLGVNGATTLKSSLDVSGAGRFASTLNVSGQTTLNGGVSINQGMMTVAGISGDISTQGIITAGGSIYAKHIFNNNSGNGGVVNTNILYSSAIRNSSDIWTNLPLILQASNATVNIGPSPVGPSPNEPTDLIVSGKATIYSDISAQGHLSVGSSSNPKKIYLNGSELQTSSTTLTFTLNVANI